MENGADALKMAFAVFVFIFALAMTFWALGSAKKTSDVVLFFSDKTNFYETKASKLKNREITDYAEIVSALYRSASGGNMEVKIYNNFNTNIAEDLYKNDNGDYVGVTTKEKVNEFLKEHLIDIQNKTYEEEFIEVPYEGIYKEGDDGSQVTIADGGKRIYITYKPIS